MSDQKQVQALKAEIEALGGSVPGNLKSIPRLTTMRDDLKAQKDMEQEEDGDDEQGSTTESEVDAGDEQDTEESEDDLKDDESPDDVTDEDKVYVEAICDFENPKLKVKRAIPGDKLLLSPDVAEFLVNERSCKYVES